jgi:3-(3-hydroxy-phenyl)propionate hydroxylase
MYDVAIVGAGPAGVIAANLCGVYGLSAVALDRAQDVYDLPRAVGMWDDVQRILDEAGVLEAVLPATEIPCGAEFTDAAGHRINGVEIPRDLRTPNGYPLIRTFHQPSMEAAARAALKRFDDVELRVSQEVVALEQNDDHVSLVVRDCTSGETSLVEARWVIGCDGASSFVRKSCGIAWDSLGYDHDWLVVDVHLKRAVNLPPLMTQVCDPERPATIIPLPLDMHRWEFQLRDGETKEEMERHERVFELLAPWLAPADAEVVRAVVYRFHATIAETFRHGRVFLAGDAAHQTPPFMGQGLCSGVRDAANLVWKIHHVTRGLMNDELLDSYTEERRPMTLAAVKHSVRTGQLIDAYAEMGRGGPEPSAELQAYAYGGSAQLPLLSTGLLAEADGEWVGQFVPQCKVRCDGVDGAFDAVVGPRWAIVSAQDPRASMSAESRRGWEALGAAYVSVPEPTGAMLGLLLAHATVVVRPDRIVYGVDAASVPALAAANGKSRSSRADTGTSPTAASAPRSQRSS